MKTEKIVKNSIRCKYCDDIITSYSVHDFVSCKCGKVAVDGGKDYLKRCFVNDPDIDFEELSVVEEIK